MGLLAPLKNFFLFFCALAFGKNFFQVERYCYSNNAKMAKYNFFLYLFLSFLSNSYFFLCYFFFFLIVFFSFFLFSFLVVIVFFVFFR